MRSFSGVFMDDRIPLDLAKAVGGTSLAWLICYRLTYGYTIRNANEPYEPVVPVTLAARLEATDRLLSLPYFSTVAAMAIKASWDLGGNEQSRWHGKSPTSRWLLMIYIARMIIDVPVQQLTMRNNPTRLLQMTAHHILSALAMGGGLATGRMHFFGCLDLCSEVTTIFLNGVFTLRTMATPGPVTDGKVAKLGMGLWLSYIGFRIVLFPYWGRLFFGDAKRNPAQTWDLLTKFEKYYYPLVNVFLFILSCIWMAPVTTGVIKAARKALSNKGENAKKLKDETDGMKKAI